MIIFIPVAILSVAAAAGVWHYLRKDKSSTTREVLLTNKRHSDLVTHMNTILERLVKREKLILKQARLEKSFLKSMQKSALRMELETLAMQHATVGWLLSMLDVTLALDLNEAERQISELNKAVRKCQAFDSLCEDFVDALHMIAQDIINMQDSLRDIEKRLPNRAATLANADKDLIACYTPEEGCKLPPGYATSVLDNIRRQKTELSLALQRKILFQIAEAIARNEPPKRRFTDDND